MCQSNCAACIDRIPWHELRLLPVRRKRTAAGSRVCNMGCSQSKRAVPEREVFPPLQANERGFFVDSDRLIVAVHTLQAGDDRDSMLYELCVPDLDELRRIADHSTQQQPQPALVLHKRYQTRTNQTQLRCFSQAVFAWQSPVHAVEGRP